MFSNQRDATSALLILRHLHDGEAIDYPVPVDSPHAHLFAQLEADGYIERWDRFWPLSDRYRLTERGAQTIRSCYRPANAAAVMQQLRARHLAPPARPQALRAMGFDPALWPILHDPGTDWRLWPAQIGPFQRYVWEASLVQPARPQPGPAARVAQAGTPLQRPYGNQVYGTPGQRVSSAWVDPSPGSPWYDSSYSSSWASEAASYAHHHHHPPHHEPFVGSGGESGGGGSSASWGDDTGASGTQTGGYDTDDLDGSSGSGGSYSDAS